MRKPEMKADKVEPISKSFIDGKGCTQKPNVHIIIWCAHNYFGVNEHREFMLE